MRGKEGPPAWGHERVFLAPADGTNTFGRDGFSIHGGWQYGSAGCIDLGAKEGEFFSYLRAFGATKVDLDVNYDQKLFTQPNPLAVRWSLSNLDPPSSVASTIDSQLSDLLRGYYDASTSGSTSSRTLFDQFSKTDYTFSLYNKLIKQYDREFFASYLDFASNYLVNSFPTLNSFSNPLFTLPIGAFYESRSPGADPAPSIAAKTPVLLDAAGRRMSEAGLYALDANHDGKLSGGELASLRAWIDTGEDGVAKPGEIVTAAAAGLTEIDHVNYIYYTLGNAVAAPSAIAAPTKPSDAQAIASPWLPNSSVPDSLSLYQSLRSSNNVFWVPSGGYITWQPTQIKINSNDPSYLIGTDANDSFDARYYAAYDGMYFNLGLLNKFLGGPGNDTVGGSARADTVWGGTGNDVLAHASGRTAFTLSDGTPIRAAARITRAGGITGAARRRRRAVRARTCAAGTTAPRGRDVVRRGSRNGLKDDGAGMTAEGCN